MRYIWFGYFQHFNHIEQREKKQYRQRNVNSLFTNNAQKNSK